MEDSEKKDLFQYFFSRSETWCGVVFPVPVLPHEQLSNFLRLIFLSTVVAVAYCDKCCGEENSLNISRDKPGQPQKSISPNQREFMNYQLKSKLINEPS